MFFQQFSSPVAKRNRECSEIVAGKKTEAEKLAIVEKTVDGDTAGSVRKVKSFSPNTNFKVRLQEELIARDGHEWV